MCLLALCRSLRLTYSVNVTQNIRPEESSGERRTLVDQLMDELTGWSPRDRAGAFKSWHRGAFSLVHLNVVTLLEAQGPLPMSHLAEALDVSDASATGIVDRMERRGLVARQHPVGDRRIVTVHLTDAGSSVFRDLEQRRRERLRELLDELTDGEIGGLLSGLRALHAARERMHERCREGGVAEAVEAEATPAR